MKEGKWLNHFHQYQDDILKLFVNGVDKIRFRFCASQLISLDKFNICDIDYLYQMRSLLCKPCINGNYVYSYTNGKMLVCMNCIRILSHNICLGKSQRCDGIKYVNCITYSTFKYCKSCTEYNTFAQ